MEGAAQVDMHSYGGPQVRATNLPSPRSLGGILTPTWRWIFVAVRDDISRHTHYFVHDVGRPRFRLFPVFHFSPRPSAHSMEPNTPAYVLPYYLATRDQLEQWRCNFHLI
jgi:hypothetical protein